MIPRLGDGNIGNFDALEAIYIVQKMIPRLGDGNSTPSNTCNAWVFPSAVQKMIPRLGGGNMLFAKLSHDTEILAVQKMIPRLGDEHIQERSKILWLLQQSSTSLGSSYLSAQALELLHRILNIKEQVKEKPIFTSLFDLFCLFYASSSVLIL